MRKDHSTRAGAGDLFSRRTLILGTLGSLLALGVFWALSSAFIDAKALKIAFLLSQVAVISIVIWQACDPFADAAQWIGTAFRLPGSVRGATLDAVASSMPELFSGIFFVLLALLTSEPESLAAAGSEGYAATVATCAGSAIYNMILIPAFCALVIAHWRKSRPTIDVSKEVLSRDGMWFVGVQIVLLVFLWQYTMHWWMAVVLIGLYIFYIFHLYYSAKAFRRIHHAVQEHVDSAGEDATTDEILHALLNDGWKVSRSTLDEVREQMLARNSFGSKQIDDEEEELPKSAGIFFGLGEIPLNHLSVWSVVAASMTVAAVACYWLVVVTHETAEKLDIPIFFVAVILVAAASSIPDTLLSIGAAKRGDDDGAVSNAFGSNIFDICICLTVPLLIYSSMNDWNPIHLKQNDEPMTGLRGLLILLAVLTMITLLIMWHRRQLTRFKAIVLCGLYGIFIAYAVLGSLRIDIFDFAS